VRFCAAILSEARSEDAVQLAFLRAYDALRSSVVMVETVATRPGRPAKGVATIRHPAE